MQEGDQPRPGRTRADRAVRVEVDDRPRKGALTKTGGYLAGFTHTLNPAVGCALGRTFCGRYCYAQHQMPAKKLDGGWGDHLVVKTGLAEALEADLRRASKRDPEHPRHVRRVGIFCSSSTEPCAGPVLDEVRACLRVLARYPIHRIVLQTRMPTVTRLEPELRALGSRAAVSLTLESDDDALWHGLRPPLEPRIRRRRRALEAMAAWPAPRPLLSATVSPCVRVGDPEGFAAWIARHADRAVVDTFTAGDGAGGKRTARTEAPERLARHGWRWDAETDARRLYRALQNHMPADRVGWSDEGFRALLDEPPEGA